MAKIDSYTTHNSISYSVNITSFSPRHTLQTLTQNCKIQYAHVLSFSSIPQICLTIDCQRLVEPYLQLFTVANKINSERHPNPHPPKGATTPTHTPVYDPTRPDSYYDISSSRWSVNSLRGTLVQNQSGEGLDVWLRAPSATPQLIICEAQDARTEDVAFLLKQLNTSLSQAFHYTKTSFCNPQEEQTQPFRNAMTSIMSYYRGRYSP